tara:strand:+ start:576 stop:695 length:120 start_codon:yes stop_codon:yes gene_type:complete
MFIYALHASVRQLFNPVLLVVLFSIGVSAADRLNLIADR